MIHHIFVLIYIILYCASSHHYVFRERVVAEGAVVEHDLVEGLRGDLGDLGAVVAEVLVFGDHRLAQCDVFLASRLLLGSGVRGERSGVKTDQHF